MPLGGLQHFTIEPANAAGFARASGPASALPAEEAARDASANKTCRRLPGAKSPVRFSTTSRVSHFSGAEPSAFAHFCVRNSRAAPLRQDSRVLCF